jgi:nicotinamidase-related amidase/type 1 glutamine amidotransferase
MIRRALALLGTLLPLSVLALSSPADEKPAIPEANRLVLHQRTQVETAPGSGRYHVVIREEPWDARKTAVVVCDMWDKHWCPTATARVAEMAPRMNEVLKAARQKGALILHCPSDTMDFYKDTPQRKLAQGAPRVETKVPLLNSCRLDPKVEPALPIDDSSGGCDCDPAPKSYRAWSRQIEALEIKDGDAITDSVEAYYLIRQRGISNVIVMGVHTNMCVLGRPFAVRQLVRQGLNVVLMRDMTDTMYSPKNRPFVSHFTGTDLVVGHIERHWCPSVTSADLLGGAPFRFKDDKRPHLVVVIGEDEYKTEQSLPPFALKQLGKDFRVSTIFASEKNPNDFPGTEVLEDADLVLVSVRRRLLPEAQLARIRKLVSAGKPVVGIRTASHAFSPRPNQKVPEGHAVWAEFDRDVLGGHYTGHYDAKLAKDGKTLIRVWGEARSHPILNGVPREDLSIKSSLYKTAPLGEKATALVLGRVEGQPNPEPVAWTNTHTGGGRVFYVALGGPEDFEMPVFRRLLRNGIYWAAGLAVPERDPEP